MSTSTQVSSINAGTAVLDSLSAYAHWPLRVALVSVFLYHGLTKFMALDMMSAMLGLPVAVMALVAVAETAGGALILIGAFTSSVLTRLGALILIPPMIGAISMFHWGHWAFTPAEGYPMGGMEFQFTLVMIMLYFLIKGNNEQ